MVKIETDPADGHAVTEKKDRHNLILLIGEFSPEIVEAIKEELPHEFVLVHDNNLKYLEEARYVIVGGGAFLPGSKIETAKNLRLIQKWGIGVDKIDLAAAAGKGIPVAITAGVNSDLVAEHAILLMLSLYKHLPYVHNKMREGVWLRKEMRSVSYMLKGKTVGIIGLGNIGKKVARKLNGFDVTPTYFDIIKFSSEIEKELNVQFRELDELLKTSDIVTLHVPLTPETRNLIDSEKISIMKSSAVIINTARGGVIDENALADALTHGRLWGAGLDVFGVEPPWKSPLIHLENVVLTPHVAGASFDNVANVARHCFKNIGLISRNLPIASEDLIS